MAEQKVKKRGWVKDAAIIFLAVMLALTFFCCSMGETISMASITVPALGCRRPTRNKSSGIDVRQLRPSCLCAHASHSIELNF